MKRLVFLCAVLLPVFVRAAEEPGTGIEALESYVDSLEGERREAGEFLLEHLPEADRKSLSTELFRENLEQAYLARETYPWTKALPKELFFNDVLPHAVVNETRDPWRKRLRELFHPHLGDSQDIRAASAVVGARIAELTGVKYDTKREKACQSPAESMRQGMASCTGLSILQVDALRAIGVPVRLVAIPMWGTMEGNHTWVEVHDGEDWQMSDYGGNPEKWNKGWEIARCAYCDPLNPVHGVFASSYRPTGIGFPMIWDWNDPRGSGSPSGLNEVAEQERDAEGRLVKLNWRLQSTPIPGIDRTAHYIELAGGRKIPIPKGSAVVAIRAFITGSESRIDVPIRVLQGEDLIMEGRTASAAQDLNDYVRILCPPGALKVEYQTAGDEWKSIHVDAAADKETPVRIEVTDEQATGFFDTEQRR